MNADTRQGPARGLLMAWRRWVSSSLTNRITVAALSLALTVALVLSVASYLALRHLVEVRISSDLERDAREVEIELRSSLGAITQDLAGLASTSLVANGLVDSAGRDTYLLPLFREHRLPIGVPLELVLCDYRGRPIASNTVGAAALRPAGAGVERAIRSAIPGASLVRAPNSVRLQLYFPVVFPPTGSTEGALVGQVDLGEVLAAAVRPHRFGSSVVLAAGGEAVVHLAGPSDAPVAKEVARAIDLGPPLDGLSLQVRLGRDASVFAPVQQVGMVYGVLGVVLVALVSLAARRGATQLTRRICSLSEVARGAAAGSVDGPQASGEPRDEVETVAEVFGATLSRLRSIQGSLEQKVQDRTAELEQRSRELRLSEERLRFALASGTHVEWDLDVVGQRFSHGPMWSELLGLLPGEVDDSQAGWELVLHPEDRVRTVAALQACIEGPSDVYRGLYRVRSGAGWKWLRSQGRVASRDATGRATRLIGTRTDVTEIEDLQQRLLAATRLASVGTLAAGVAHEINNPLTYVLGSLTEGLGLVEPGGRTAALRESLEGARAGAERIASVVRAMQSLGRPERQDDLHVVDVRAELLDSIQMVRNQLAQRARLDVSIEADLPKARARTSELGRVFLNLLVNAAQAIPEGNVLGNRIAVEARRQQESILVEVSDTGEGIPAEIRTRVFEAFFTTKPVGVGTGLGLTLARSIVDAAGGTLDFESEPGRHTVFRVRLPVAPEAPPEPRARPLPPKSGRSGPLRVMLIDDEPMVRRSIERMLRPRCAVTALTSATEALGVIGADGAWDAILCDLMMAGLDGVGFYERLEATHPVLTPKLAFVTGGAFGDRTLRFLDEHDVTIIPKPVLREELLEAVERLASTPIS